MATLQAPPLLSGHPDEEFARTGPPGPPAAEDLHPAVVWAGRIALAAAAALIAITRPGPWLPFAAFVFGLGLAKVAGWHGRQLRLIAFALAVFTSAVNYLCWRLTVVSFAGSPVPGWVVGIPLYLAEFHAAIHTVGLHATLWPRHTPAPHDAAHGARQVEPADRIDPAGCPIFVFVPTVDEGPEIVGATLRGIIAARDAFLAVEPDATVTVIVCNDGGVAGADCSDAVEALAAELGVECVTRQVGGGAKAGNIENARRLYGGSGDALLVIFDADQIPREDFFLRTVPPFADPGIGWVQTGQYYGNRDNPVARWADDQQSLFYRLLCPGKAVHDSAFICGTNVVLRAAALDEIGGLPTDSVTEDFAASIHLAPRWRPVYLPGILAVGLGPVDLTSYLKQQERWARGTLSVLRDHWRDLVFVRRGGLRAQQRMQYALAVTHYLCGVRDLVFAVAPVLFLLTGISGVRGATAGAFLGYFVPYYLVAIVGFWHAAWRVTNWRAIVIGYGSFPALLRAAWMTAVGRRGRFTLTPKRRSGSSPWRTAWPHLTVLTACLASLVLLVLRKDGPAYWLAGFWLLYLCAMSGVYLTLVVADVRAAGREPAETRVPRAEPHERPSRVRTVRIRKGRRRLVVRAAAATALAGGATVLAVGAQATAVHGGPPPAPTRPYFGVSAVGAATGFQLPGGARPTLVGRAMEIGDSFDASWAAAVADGGGVPWLTLVFSDRGRAGVYTSLTAIGNGSDDAAIGRWAAAIAGYGRPIYLTVLPEVDRNYPATSAVAGGGIPQDVAPAWTRMRNLFRSVGAANAAWVWNPADPAADQQFSPPAGQIDAVGVTLYEYPGQPWADPAGALAAAARSHPGKPLLADVAVDGPAAARAAWMAALGSAVEHRPDMAAVVYHDTGPVADPADPAAGPWKLDADQEAPAAFARIGTWLAAQGGGAVR